MCADLDTPYLALAAAILGFGVRATVIFRRHERRECQKQLSISSSRELMTVAGGSAMSDGDHPTGVVYYAYAM